MININLIAERRARRIREMTIIRVSLLCVAALTIVMVLWNLTAFFLNDSATKELKNVNRMLKDQETRYQKWQEIEAEILARQPVVTLLEQVQKSESAWMMILADLSQITPNDVVIDGMATNSKDKVMQLTIKGRAKDAETIGNYMLAFSKDTLWAENAVLNNVSGKIKNDSEGNVVGKPIVDFELKVPIRGLVGGNL